MLNLLNTCMNSLMVYCIIAHSKLITPHTSLLKCHLSHEYVIYLELCELAAAAHYIRAILPASCHIKELNACVEHAVITMDDCFYYYTY